MYHDRFSFRNERNVRSLFFSFGWATSWFSWLVGLPADFHHHFLFLTSVVIDLPWPYFFSRIFQRDILDFLSPTDISCAHAGGLFHFRKGQGTYSIDPADYPEKPLYAAAPDNRLLNEFFLLILQDVHEWQSLGALQFTSDEPQFVKELIERVYPEIPSTSNAPALPETRVFSRPLIAAYMAVYLQSKKWLQSAASPSLVVSKSLLCRAQNFFRPPAFI